MRLTDWGTVGVLSLLVWGCDDTATVAPNAEQGQNMADATPPGAEEGDLGPNEDLGTLDSDAESPGPDAGSPLPDEGVMADSAVITRPLAPRGSLAPVGRVIEMAIPEDPIVARQSGCLVYGASAGTGPYNLNVVAGGTLFRPLEPRHDGQIPLVLLFRALGWPEGDSAQELTTVDLEFFSGNHSLENGFTADPQHFVDESPENDALVHFPDASLQDGWFAVARSTFEIPFSILDSPTLPVVLQGAHLRGRIAADGPGLRVDHGVLTGYIDFDSVVGLVGEIREVCQGGQPFGACALIGGQLDQPDAELAQLVLSILGNFDAQLINGVGYPCDVDVEGECNAIGLCVTYSVRGIELVDGE